eukprot:gene1026-2012_t
MDAMSNEDNNRQKFPQGRDEEEEKSYSSSDDTIETSSNDHTALSDITKKDEDMRLLTAKLDETESTRDFFRENLLSLREEFHSYKKSIGDKSYVDDDSGSNESHVVEDSNTPRKLMTTNNISKTANTDSDICSTNVNALLDEVRRLQSHLRYNEQELDVTNISTSSSNIKPVVSVSNCLNEKTSTLGEDAADDRDRDRDDIIHKKEVEQFLNNFNNNNNNNNTNNSTATTFRCGKWILEEETYATRLITEFEKGTLTDCDVGCSLRTYLSTKLNCVAMRISKKFVGRPLGKCLYRKNIHADSALINRIKEELDDLRQNWLLFESYKSSSNPTNNNTNITNNNNTTNTTNTIHTTINSNNSTNNTNYPTNNTNICTNTSSSTSSTSIPTKAAAVMSTSNISSQYPMKKCSSEEDNNFLETFIDLFDD